MSKKAPPVAAPAAPAYAVFRNQHRHTCIKVPGPLRRGKPDETRTYYIPMDPLEVAVKSSPTTEFYSEFEPVPDYPVKRAAELYLYTEKFKAFTPEARRHLEVIVADPAYSYSADRFSKQLTPPVAKEPEMTTEAPAKKTAPAKKAAAAPAKKAATAAPAKQPAAKKAPAVPAKGAKPAVGDKKESAVKAAAKAPSPGRLNDTDKIVIVAAENPKRAETKAHAMFELYKKTKTVGAYKAADGDTGYLNFDIKAGFVKIEAAK